MHYYAALKVTLLQIPVWVVSRYRQSRKIMFRFVSQSSYTRPENPHALKWRKRPLEEYGQNDESFSPQVMAYIASWLQGQIKFPSIVTIILPVRI
jgi:hypothetical protein